MEPIWRAQAGLALAAIVGMAAVAGAAPGVEVKKAWGPVRAPEGGVFVEMAPRADGGLLAATGNRVSSIDPAGRMTLLGGGGDRAILDPAGRAFGLWEQGSFQVYDQQNGRRGSLPAPPVSIFKLVPGGALVYAPRVELRREEEWVEAVRLVRADGTVAAEFPAPGLESSRLLPDRIVYSLPDFLQARGLDGGELWRARLQVHKFESARDRTILVPRQVPGQQVPGQVIHLEKGQRLTEERIEGIVWNLAIAPGSRFSAATTQTILYLFRDGRNAATVRLPVAYANSLDVSDRGEALVGGQGRQGDAQLFLYGADGTLLWRDKAGADRNGWRPAVRFAPGGDRFLVLESQGITAYDIVRSQP